MPSPITGTGLLPPPIPARAGAPGDPQSRFQVTEQRHLPAPLHTNTLGLPREHGLVAAPSPPPRLS